MNTKVKLKIQEVTDSQVQSGAYALILAEEDGNRVLPVIIGLPEAQAILVELENFTPPRPLTHDLFTKIFDAFDIYLREVCIYKYLDGVFYSELIFEKNFNGNEVHIDARTSDAISIAIREDCDIYVEEEIMNTCGIAIENDDMDDKDEDGEDDDDASRKISDLDIELLEELDLFPKEGVMKSETGIALLSRYNKPALRKRLEEAIRKEKYEYAKIYNDELIRRETEGE